MKQMSIEEFALLITKKLVQDEFDYTNLHELVYLLNYDTQLQEALEKISHNRILTEGTGNFEHIVRID